MLLHVNAVATAVSRVPLPKMQNVCVCVCVCVCGYVRARVRHQRLACSALSRLKGKIIAV